MFIKARNLLQGDALVQGRSIIPIQFVENRGSTIIVVPVNRPTASIILPCDRTVRIAG